MKTTKSAAGRPANPWWREPWPWLLMAGPALALIACFVTIALALDGYARERIDDGGKKQGLVVTRPVAAETFQTEKPAGD